MFGLIEWAFEPKNSVALENLDPAGVVDYDALDPAVVAAVVFKGIPNGFRASPIFLASNIEWSYVSKQTIFGLPPTFAL